MTTQRSAVDQLRASLELLWRDRERPARGPKPTLTLERIVEAAIAVADAEGLDAVSMRRVAAELGVGTMSLYRYVPGKSTLIALMLDTVSDPAECIDPLEGEGWRARLEAVARGSYRLYLAHPWLLRTDWRHPVFGPNTLARVEYVIASLSGLGLTDHEQVTVMIALDGYVSGFARQRLEAEALPEVAGVSEFWEQHYPTLEKAMNSGAYPALAALAGDSFSLGWEESFEFGLARLLDGVAVLVDSRRGVLPEPSPGADTTGE